VLSTLTLLLIVVVVVFLIAFLLLVILGVFEQWERSFKQWE
jgi:hypothetical protein